MDLNTDGSGLGPSKQHHKADSQGGSGFVLPSNVMMGAMFSANQPSKGGSCPPNLAMDRRAVLDLFSLYAKTVKIIWTYESTEYCCNADAGRCSFVTKDLKSFLQHAAETHRCESCDQHVHSPVTVNGQNGVFCDKCSSLPEVADCVNNNGLLLDMTVDRSKAGEDDAANVAISDVSKAHREPRSLSEERESHIHSQNQIPILEKNKSSKEPDEKSHDQLFGLAIIPESQVKVSRRGRPPRAKLNSICNAGKVVAETTSTDADEGLLLTPTKKEPINVADLSSSSVSQDSSNFNQANKEQEQEGQFQVESAASQCGGDDELVECNHCGRLLRKESLRTHIARRHENARHHTCQFCDYQSYDAYVMREHVRRHLGQYLFKCDLCDFAAVKKYQLDSHMRRHTGEKPFQCSACAFRSAWKVQLKSHVPLHEQGTEEERSARTCQVCGVLFSSSGTFTRHPCIRGPSMMASTATTSSSANNRAVSPVKVPTKKRMIVSRVVIDSEQVSDVKQEPVAVNGCSKELPSSNADSSNVVLRKRSFRVPLVLPAKNALQPNAAVDCKVDSVKATSHQHGVAELSRLPIFQVAVATSTIPSSAVSSFSSSTTDNCSGAVPHLSQQPSSPRVSSLLEVDSASTVEHVA